MKSNLEIGFSRDAVEGAIWDLAFRMFEEQRARCSPAAARWYEIGTELRFAWRERVFSLLGINEVGDELALSYAAEVALGLRRDDLRDDSGSRPSAGGRLS